MLLTELCFSWTAISALITVHQNNSNEHGQGLRLRCSGCSVGLSERGGKLSLYVQCWNPNSTFPSSEHSGYFTELFAAPKELPSPCLVQARSRVAPGSAAQRSPRVPRCGAPGAARRHLGTATLRGRAPREKPQSCGLQSLFCWNEGTPRTK